mmetsp:Transcript_19838/g.41586  ORF Transcript_19838/g.41586 Transcript_19838/m.41586 type:complete len:80 (-) Transcript_19838:441-680(-)
MCVVMIMARSGVAKEDTRLQISFRVEGSSPVVGSSRSNVFGDPSNETAMESLLLIPPDRLPLGLRNTAGAPKPTAFAIS